MPLPKIILDKSKQIHKACKDYHVKELYLFGSSNKGKINKDSDLDFLVNFEEMEFGNYTENYFQFISKLEELLGFKIDLITKKSLTNPYFIKSIEKNMSKIYV